MKEAIPRKVSPPENGEPELRVGIVLAEDKKKVIKIQVPSAGYICTVDGREYALRPGESYTVSVSALQLNINDASNKPLLSATKTVELLVPSDATIGPQSGIKIETVIVGRGFHWQKNLVQTLPGSLELIPDAEFIVVVNKVKFEDYITCVISSEMSPECPADFMKAQAVAARSWVQVFLGYKHVGAAFTICNDDDCQRYQGTTHLKQKAIDAIHGCAGEFLVTQSGNICPAYYSKSCGGYREDPKLVFGFEAEGIEAGPDAMPATDINLQESDAFKAWCKEAQPFQAFCSAHSVPEAELPKYLGAVDVKARYYRWKHSISARELIRNLQYKYQLNDIASIQGVEIGERGRSGRILTLRIKYIDGGGGERAFELKDQYEIRKALHESFLYSSAFALALRRNELGTVSGLELEGCGWGHGIGLCQIGALGMALQGKDYRSILKHYYPGAEIKKAY